MSYKLFLDDQRGEPQGWILVSNYEEFIKIITERGLPDHIAFDHDLGYEWNDELEQESFDQRARTGLDCARWLVDNNLIPKQFSVHSWNYVGARHIGLLLEEHGSKPVDSPSAYETSYKKQRR